jgi:hypothetical protein
MVLPRSRRAKTCGAVLLVLALAIAPLACTQLIGADKNRQAAAALDEHLGEGDALAPIATTTSAVPACPTGQKRCDGACVDVDDPAYGCSPTECLPRCSLKFADIVKCTAGKCAVGTCLPGRADCNGKGDDGCESNLGNKATCGNCTTACGGGKPYCTPAGTCVDTCVSPFTVCGTAPNDECIDPTTSADNCGTCGTICPPHANAEGKCAASTCTIACRTGFANCDGNELNGCEPLAPYYKDEDGDGFGAGAKAGEACTPPAGNSLVATDCLDSNAMVKPGQTEWFTSGYTKADGTVSFDYDCSNAEEAKSAFAIGTCIPCAQGQVPAASRVGALNAYCGSTSYNSCGSSGCVIGPAPQTIACH